MDNIDKKLENRNFFFDMVKGFFMGSGFIVPGVSGGAISAIFGIYKPLITWLSNIRENFKKNIRYFTPIALGAIIGIGFFSLIVYIRLGAYKTIMLWAFVGAIVGMLPSLWKDAGKEGRDRKDLIIMAISFILAFTFLFFGEKIFNGNVKPSFLAWLICGVLISLGLLVPGLSPSNFILYMGLYEKMAEGFAKFNLSIIIPIIIGAVLTIGLLSKLIEGIFNRHYSKFYHLIVGVVIASTLMIVPLEYGGFTLFDYFLCLCSFLLGRALGLCMAKLEQKYK